MKVDTPESTFSPLLVHQQVMTNMSQVLGYAGGDVAAWQHKLRAKVRELTGYPPVAEKVPLNVRSLWTRKTRVGTIEKVVFTSELYADVPAYVCTPRLMAPPYLWFICLQGHSSGMHASIGVDGENEAKRIRVKGDRNFAIGCMKRGIAALCIEQRCFGERRERRQTAAFGGCHDAAMRALMMGRTLIGERVYDVNRAIDYLETRDDVLRDRIGIMGLSGGGTVAMYAAALLPRLAYGMPACSFCTFKDSIMSIPHCSDNYIPGLLRYAEMADILGLFAPKPLVIVAGKDDPVYPIKGVRKAFRKLREIYSAVGAEKKLRLVIGEGGHRFYADAAWKRMAKYLDM
ncbi:MAG: hypothetical protein GF344_11445 [Chitinivibrionales bacterium]|nr:hypothetical protein [Chitinivibrionales bacterium]MBD3357415.1 hypothetical protein [Chitinivibrionales bacterium]